jgi:hypothetical protein
MENQKQLSELTVTELKAIAYDQVAAGEMAQNNLRIINQELARRMGSPTDVINPLPAGSIQRV